MAGSGDGHGFSRKRTTIIGAVLATILFAALAHSATAGEGRGAETTPRGSSAAEALADLNRQGLTVLVTEPARDLIVPGELRGRPVNGADLVEALAAFHGMTTAWNRERTAVVLYPIPADASPPTTQTAEGAWRAGWARDPRAIPGLVEATASSDLELAWQASRALQRIGWAPTLALGGDAAWSRQVAAADRAAYRGRRIMGVKEPDHLEFVRAAGALALISGDRPRQFIEEGLQSRNRRVRAAAIMSARRLAPDEGRPLLDRALDDPSRQVRAAAAGAAGHLNVVTALERLLSDNSQTIRYRAVTALGEGEDDRAGELLERALADTDPGLRRRALTAMTRADGERAFRVASNLVRDEAEEKTIRARAAVCLAQVGGERALELLEPLREEYGLRFAVVVALGYAGEAALPTLEKLIAEDETNEQTRIRALESVVMIGGDEAARLLASILGDAEEDEYYRAAACRAMGEMGGSRALAGLREALGDRAAVVRTAATRALSRVGDPGALDLLPRALDDDDIGIRADAAEAAAHFNPRDERVHNLLSRALEDEERYVRAKAMEAMEMLDSRTAAQLLGRALSSEDGDTRLGAIRALGRAGGPDALTLIAPLVDDDHTAVRMAAAEALGEIGGAEALEKLGEMLANLLTVGGDQRNENVRSGLLPGAINGVLRAGGPRALPILENGLERASSHWRRDEHRLFTSALGELGGADSEALLEVLEAFIAREDFTPEASRNALEAMGRVPNADRERVLRHMEKHVTSVFVEGERPGAHRAWSIPRKEREDAARGLGYLGGPEAADLLQKAHAFSEKLAEQDERWLRTLRTEVVPIAEAAERAEAVDLLRIMAAECLSKRGRHYIEIGVMAIRGLSDFANEDDVELLEKTMVNSFGGGFGINVNYAATDALGAIGGEKARDALLDAYIDPDLESRVRGHVENVLKARFPGDPEVEKALD